MRLHQLKYRILALSLASLASATNPTPRSVIVRGGQFVDATTNETVIFSGANVVFKGAPWLPAVTGDTYCKDTPTSTCKTFNAHDAIHITQDKGWNFIRLGVTWAGAQPTPDPVLDPTWVTKLHAILDLCHAHGISVVLDMHQDAVGTAVCGEGVPQWFSKLAVPNSIGKPLSIAKVQKDGTCGKNDTANWALHAGEDDYNIKNPCCLHYNQGGWSNIIGSTAAQETLAYLFNEKGRTHYATFMGLLAAAVVDKPAAIGIELMNEPPAIQLEAMYETWQASYDAIRAQVPDIAVGLCDTGEAPLPLTHAMLSEKTKAWIKNADYLFYAFHWVSQHIHLVD
jgi:hypothetical protein